MALLRGNILLLFAAMALISAVVLVMTGNAVDGASLLAVLYTIIGGVTGGHLMAQTPGAEKTNAPGSGA